MAINEQGHYGKYSGNARCCVGHPYTRVDRYNYKATERDDAAHIDYLKRDVLYDDHHGHDDEKMVADEKHISKLAGDMKYDKMHHGPGKEKPKKPKKPKKPYEGGEFDPNVPVEGEVVGFGERQGPSGEIVTIDGVKYRRVGKNLFPYQGPADFQGNLHAAQMKHSESGEHLGMKPDAPAKMMEGPAKHCFGPAKYAYDSPSKRYCIK